ncbi:MAG: hypothetical protein ACOY0T_21255 [Myxococcota bacterium]
MPVSRLNPATVLARVARLKQFSSATQLAAQSVGAILLLGNTVTCSSEQGRRAAVGGTLSNSGGSFVNGGGSVSSSGTPSRGGVAATGGGGGPASGGSSSSGRAGVGGATAGGGGGDLVAGGGAGGQRAGGWVVAHIEDFSGASLGTAAWSVDPIPDDGPFADNGAYFRARGVQPPKAFRLSQPFGDTNWLTLESYTRDAAVPVSDLASVVRDPAGGENRVLRIRSMKHTDASVVRPSAALPPRYRVSLRVGHASFGDGASANNGYDTGNEIAEPWLAASATSENGFYWLTILDAVPRPHNNVWIHHHRKVCIDSDNTTDGWMNIWNGASCEQSGTRPVMMFAIDGNSPGSVNSGKAFRSYRGGRWSSDICALDAYRDARWYSVSIERFDDRFTLSVAGDFVHGGQATYTGTIDAAKECVWHFNNAALPQGHACEDLTYYAALGANYPHWPSGVAYPDYFMFGDPHVNFYEGTVYYDDVKLEIWTDAE